MYRLNEGIKNESELKMKIKNESIKIKAKK